MCRFVFSCSYLLPTVVLDYARIVLQNNLIKRKGGVDSKMNLAPPFLLNTLCKRSMLLVGKRSNSIANVIPYCVVLFL